MDERDDNFFQAISPWARELLAEAGIVFEGEGLVATSTALNACLDRVMADDDSGDDDE